MRKIGLIGGMSFESSAVYYKLINEAVRARLGGIASAEIILHSVNFAEIVELQTAGRWNDAARRLGDAAENMERTGAECMLICTNTMHLIADEVADRLSVPLIHIVDVTARALKSAGVKRPLLLATRYTMEHGFYAERMKTNGIDILVPDSAGRALTHEIIFKELCAGQVLPESRQKLLDLIDMAQAQGADSVILGCTEICMILDPNTLTLPGFDSTALHAEAAVDFALAPKVATRAA
ncbi:aspartate/glutamate racemase family protein [Peteryoungia desertarenae]|uniref:Aspartate/glutamate racemase family protein n=1 Tax=Peteryoungia desertarenae TaxID=1813451 RepID=A0ABX6QQJ0_9HYPH|nr:aspartate/glutamate racemase family protein [Peteryoungia desertarenae]QLF70783.1 aspartate/glutamate racemase family protein [Peteryoungia desertarenae]